MSSQELVDFESASSSPISGSDSPELSMSRLKPEIQSILRLKPATPNCHREMLFLELNTNVLQAKSQETYTFL